MRICQESQQNAPILPSASEVAAALLNARQRSLDLMADLSDEQLRVPLLPIINPLLWEFGHVAWFQEKWVLRHLRREPPGLANADALWDSAAVAHDTRWGLPLPSRSETLRYAEQVLDRALSQLSQNDLTRDQAYFHWLVVMHEDMHGEALTYTRQTLGLPAPTLTAKRQSVLPASAASVPCEGDVEIPGGSYLLGADPNEILVFDNEKWAHPVPVPPFAIARTPVTNRQFADFVEDGGYGRDELWSEEGLAWRKKEEAQHPVYWVRDAGGWLHRRFYHVVPLPDNLPVVHVNWYEAEAYCRWARRRLPSEAEWELAATAEPAGGEFSRVRRHYPWGENPPGLEQANLDARRLGPTPIDALEAGDSAFGCRQMIGNIWEWTASEFRPYPGFVVDPYKEYSQPWFTPAYKVLRGGCWATRGRLIRNTWRNFHSKDRHDVFAGFRTCALGEESRPSRTWQAAEKSILL